MELRDRIVVVTGGGSGIGRATAALAGDRGARVAVWDLDAESGTATERELAATGVATLFVETDVSDPASVDRAAAATVQRLGGIDVLIAAAAVGGYGSLTTTREEVWRRVMAVDLDGVFWSLRAAAAHMARVGGGSVVLVGSDRALAPEPGWGAYGAAKAAVVHLARTAALELADVGVRVNVVCPGPTDTAMLGELRSFAGVHEHLATRPPLRRLAQPTEIADTLLYCAGHEFMTGSVIVVDGGAALAGPLGVRDAMRRSREPR